MDIYVTSSKNLVEYSNLKVASIKVKGEMDANYNISGKGKFKFIYSDKNRDGEMDSLPSNNNEEFKFIKASNVPDNDNNLGQDGEKPGTDNNLQAKMKRIQIMIIIRIKRRTLLIVKKSLMSH